MDGFGFIQKSRACCENTLHDAGPSSRVASSALFWLRNCILLGQCCLAPLCVHIKLRFEFFVFDVHLLLQCTYVISVRTLTGSGTSADPEKLLTVGQANSKKYFCVCSYVLFM